MHSHMYANTRLPGPNTNPHNDTHLCTYSLVLLHAHPKLHICTYTQVSQALYMCQMCIFSSTLTPPNETIRLRDIRTLLKCGPLHSRGFLFLCGLKCQRRVGRVKVEETPKVMQDE